MATMDVFNTDAFSMMSLLNAAEKVDYLPQRLGQLPLFTPVPVTTETVAIEERNGTLNLIQTDERGAPLGQRVTEKRKVRNFSTVRLAKGDKIKASEIQGIRAFGQQSELMQVMTEVARRMYGPASLMTDLQLTWELHRLGAIQGKLLDADGSTIYDFFSEFGITEPDEIDFDLDAASPASGAVRLKCTEVVRAVLRGLKGLGGPGTMVYGLCGDTFWDQLTAHSEVRQTYLNTMEARQLRDGLAYESFSYGGIMWENYRGTDDNSTVAIGATKCRFFPVNAPGAFQWAMAPGETMEVVNTPGRDFYPMVVPDRDRNMFVDIEVYSYPLFICTRPNVLQRAKNT